MERRLALVVPNIHRLQDVCRASDIEVVFTRICSMTKDGRDRSLAHKELGHLFPPGSKEAEILDDLAPGADEMVFDKTTGSVFNSTPIHYVLQNIGIQNLIMVGMMTGGCVESAAATPRISATGSSSLTTRAAPGRRRCTSLRCA